MLASKRLTNDVCCVKARSQVRVVTRLNDGVVSYTIDRVSANPDDAFVIFRVDCLAAGGSS